MRHNLTTQTQKGIKKIGANRKLFLALLLGIISSFFHSANGQCTLACNGTPTAPSQVAVNHLCEATLIPDAILESEQSCPGDKMLTIRDSMNVLIEENTNIITFDASPYIGQVLSVTVTDVTSGIFCVGFIMMADNIPPTILCENETISCFADTSVAAVGVPEAFDNCDNAVSLSHVDVYVEGDCLSPNAAVINRQWTAVDNSGNTTSCVQTIFLERPTLTAIDFPQDQTLDCDNPNADPVITGQPLFAGEVIAFGNMCDLAVSRSDDTTSICGMVEYQIIRQWTVTDLCSGETVTDPQVILFQDAAPPQITCPDDMLVQAIAGECYATVTLPAPVVTDNCDGNPDFYVSTSFGTVGLGPHAFVPVGTHVIQYTGVDECGNTTICTMNLTVEDNESPVAVCESFTNVSVPSTGMGIVMAQTFDDGSSDNCVDTIYLKTRRMIAGGCDGLNGDDSDITGYQEWFDDYVVFCCEEADTGDILVLLRVYEIDPGEGPVDPSREIIGGDLFGHFTECMINVSVQDKIAPVMDCPDDVTIECDADYSDLSIFGSPAFSDNCGATLDSIEVVDIDDCGVGLIIRTFTATDYSGNATVCVQTITVTNSNPLNESQIIWPPTYVTNICGAATDPEDLPEEYQEPIITGENCGIISINYEDMFFNIAQPACYKILRQWTVLDWCQYDPEYPENGGRFTHTQLIKVEDNIAPVINCLDDIHIGVSSDCETGVVTLDEITTIDCQPNVIISNDSPYADAAGADASGIYPIGTTVVTFTASDRCGNVSTCQVSITVSDLASPGPICIVGLSLNLAEVGGEITASIDAMSFNGGSSDNCTADEDLIFTIRVADDNQTEPPTTSVLAFTCEDLGTKLIEFWVTDEAGNSDYCLTYLAIQDNSEICPFTSTTAMIAGTITTEDGEYVEDVEVQVNTNNPAQSMTNDAGSFQFNEVPVGDDYTLLAEKTTGILNGVSTFDLILISKHILGIDYLDSPYKIIAADIDKSGIVSTLDLIKLRKLILDIDDALPNGNKSWRFVKADFVFPDPTNPFSGYFPEIYNINDFDLDMMEADFIAIKVGDVNGTAVPNNLLGLEDRNLQGDLRLMVDNLEFEAGERITLDFTATDMQSIQGYQFTLNFDPEALQFDEIVPGELSDLSASNFGTHDIQEGWLTTSWNRKTIEQLGEKTILFSLKFTAHRTSSLDEILFLSSRKTTAEAYQEDGDTWDVSLQFEEINNSAAPQEKLKLYQNRPNPFEDQTVIAFEMPESAVATFTVSDATGQLIYTYEAHFDQGYNELLITKDKLPVSGVLYYQIITGSFKASKKMVLLE